jgi:methylenetetrahydrofolate dehydrogenase (NADP+)/methenyltetrahydrofolate cyclohydrolase
MTATIIDGKAVAAKVRERVVAATAKLKAEHGIVPGLATVLAKVRALNADKSVHGILVQMPLPRQVRDAAVLDTLDPAKDVDALTPYNAGLLLSGRAHLVSCTPAGVMMLLKEYVGDIAGMEALVIGRSLLFGKPAAQLLLAANATVTMAHSRTRDLREVCRRADILVAAIGKPNFVPGDWVKPGAVVLDVGINRIDVGGGKTKVVGDVVYDEAATVARAITPVPGGVGAMTIVNLMRNTLIAAAAIHGLPPLDI